MFQPISEYMQKSRDDRKGHLALEEPCMKRGGHRNNFRGVLAEYLGTEFPAGMKIHLCHACNDGECSNPRHLYWGTAAENTQDQIENGTHQNLAERTRKKLGEVEYKVFIKGVAGKGGASKRNI